MNCDVISLLATSPFLGKLYGSKEFVEERHRHRYEVNPEFVPVLEEKGLKFVGKSTDLQRMEIMELKGVPVGGVRVCLCGCGCEGVHVWVWV